jgi:hypothetical protein
MRTLQWLVLACLTEVLLGCVDPQGSSLDNQSLGRATGWFTQITSDNVLCSLQSIGSTSLDLTFYRGPDRGNDLVTVRMLPLSKKAQRFQQVGSFEYGFSDPVSAPVELERGAAIVDPRFTDEVKASAIASHTSYYFPLTVHRLRVAAGHYCNVDLSTTRPIPTDCIDVPEGSGLDEAHFWCDVAVTADLKWSE